MSPDKTVLYLSYDGLSDHIGQSQVLPYIISCAKRGVKFHLLTFEKAANAAKIEKIQQLLDEHGILWHRMEFTVGRGIRYKVYDFRAFVTKAFALTKKYRYAVIHSRSYIASCVGYLVSRRYKVKQIFDKRDFWIDAVVETGRLKTSGFPHGPVYRGLRWFERNLFEKSAHIISLTHRAKEIVLQKYPNRKPEDITVIPCCVDTGLFDPSHIPAADTEALRARLGLKDATVFGYVGSIGVAYMVPELLECFKAIKRKVPDARLLFLVNNDPEEVKRVAEEAGLSREDIVVTSAPRAEMPLYISALHYGLFFITPTFAKQATSPTKSYEMLAMGKSIITNAGVGDAGKIFEELACGYLLPATNAAEYEKAAAWVAQRQPVGCSYDLDNYSLQFGADNYFRVYQKLLS
ncbi:glycosyltransferase [Flaviaesturariibacter flavus]|uniref:Glycosyltransferase n=1 Tax=Flaviaesturariibacter flavus TaxID=2502780 RepID=A0A4R1BB55_9BACT|nr:glycosyltransferase [Flaviaesturariibacter flavus]TCJ14193.1 glycosyltransferase [Flaviaesturariibacter flavus]